MPGLAGFERLDWFDVVEYLNQPALVANLWVDEIEKRIPSRNLDFVTETFLRAGLRAYRSSFGRKVVAKEVWTASGYSKSTFHRTFETFSSYQLKLYQFLGDMAVVVYSDYLNARDRAPEDFCRFTRNCIYSSHLAVPRVVVSEIYRVNSPISPRDFHPFVSRAAADMYSYIRCRRHMGYRQFSQSGLEEVIRTLDYDILFSKISDQGAFPNAEQAFRLERMLLAYIT